MPVVVAYDDEQAYRRAVRLLFRTTGQLNDGGGLRLQPWSFSAFESPQFREYACAGASRSPILMISVSGPELPESVRTWLSSPCVCTRKSAALFVALFGPQMRQANRHRPLLNYLRHIATQAGFTFLAPTSSTTCSIATSLP